MIWPPFFRLFILLICSFLALAIGNVGRVQAAGIEILTPRAGAKIIARNPETHLILRNSPQSGPVKIKVEKTGETISPELVMDGGDFNYLHFRLPMIPGKNSYSLIPGGERLEISFQMIQADINMKSLPKDAYFFHQNGPLPESCADCHELQDVEVVEPVGVEKQNSCAVCHKNLVDKGKVKHGPVANLECLRCHQQSKDPLKIGFPVVRTQELCLICHTSKKEWLSRKNMHGPILLGGCTLCHNPHGEDYKYQLWAEGSTTLCVTCHSNKGDLISGKGKVAYVHGIIFGNGCVACHDPHASNDQFMLIRPINELCLSCHPTVVTKSQGHPVARHPVSGKRDYLRPGRELVCTSCHEPHGSSHQYFLIETKLGGRLCRGCHKR